MYFCTMLTFSLSIPFWSRCFRRISNVADTHALLLSLAYGHYEGPFLYIMYMAAVVLYVMRRRLFLLALSDAGSRFSVL